MKVEKEIAKNKVSKLENERANLHGPYRTRYRFIHLNVNTTRTGMGDESELTQPLN